MFSYLFKSAKLVLPRALVASALLWTSAAAAVDYSLSAFGTLQYTVGDNEKNYLRFANEDGTLKVNSILGLQADVKFNQYFSGAVQYVVSPRQTNDSGTEIDTRWAFLDFHPTDNWSLKVGRQRLNLYLDSENLDVGHTYVPANLSPELYFNPGVLGADGGSLTYRNYDAGGRYWTLQTLFGQAEIVSRSGPSDLEFPRNHFDIAGISLRVEGDNYRAQLSHHDTDVSRDIDGKIQGIPAKGFLTANAKFTNASAEYDIGRYSVRAEYALLELKSQLFVTSPIQALVQDQPKYPEEAANLLLIRKIGLGHAAYLSYGRFLSQFDDQHSIAVGFKYGIDPNQSLKAELMQVNEKDNRPSISDNRVPGTTFHLLSVSYNWVWP